MVAGRARSASGPRTTGRRSTPRTRSTACASGCRPPRSGATRPAARPGGPALPAGPGRRRGRSAPPPRRRGAGWGRARRRAAWRSARRPARPSWPTGTAAPGTARLHRPPADHFVVDRVAALDDDRRLPAEELVDGQGQHRVVHAHGGRRWSGCSARAVRPFDSRLRRRLVARDERRETEHHRVEVAEPLAVDLARDHDRAGHRWATPAGGPPRPGGRRTAPPRSHGPRRSAPRRPSRWPRRTICGSPRCPSPPPRAGRRSRASGAVRRSRRPRRSPRPAAMPSSSETRARAPAPPELATRRTVRLGGASRRWSRGSAGRGRAASPCRTTRRRRSTSNTPSPGLEPLRGAWRSRPPRRGG